MRWRCVKIGALITDDADLHVQLTVAGKFSKRLKRSKEVVGIEREHTKNVS